MEIARLEISTQKHLEHMQETVKVNYVQYGKSTKKKKPGKFQQSGTSGGSSGSHGSPSKSGEKGKKVPLPPDTFYKCGKGRHQKGQDCKALDAVCRDCGTKGHFEKVCLKAKHSANLLEVP